MDPFTIGAIAAPVVGGLLGGSAGSSANDAARRQREAALAEFANIKLPTVADQSLSLEDYQNAGLLTPEMLEAIGLGDTALAGVSTDPRLKAEQMQALAQIAGFASGNPTSADMAGFELARQNVGAELNAQNNKVLQDMQQRGVAGSGAELLAKLKNNQIGAQTLANQQMEEAKAMQAARMQALQQQANMASGIRSQDYNEASNLANARDAIAKYNAQNSQNVAATNVGARNNAQAANLQNAQNISNMNTQTANQQQQHNKGLIQQNFQNQMNLAGAKAGIQQNNANATQQQGANTAGQWATIGQGAGEILANFNKK